MRGSTGLVAALLVLAACGSEDRTQTGYVASNDKTSTSTDDTTAVPPRAVPGRVDTLPAPLPPQDTIAVALAPLGRSTLRGSGQLGAVGSSTSVSVTLAAGGPGVTYEGAVRQGSCALMGSAVASLVPVTSDSLGNGRAASDIPVPLDSLLGGPHVVVYGPGGRPETCAPVGRTAALRPDSARADSLRRRQG